MEAPAKKRKVASKQQQQKIKQLESLLFGSSDAIDDFGKEEAGQLDGAAAQAADYTGPAWEDEDDLDVQRGPDSATDVQQVASTSGRPAAAAAVAWEDPDDMDVQVNIAAQARLRKLRRVEGEEVLSGREYEKRLRRQHKALHSNTKWAAALRPEGADEAAEAVLAGAAGQLLAGRPALLPPHLLDVTRLKDANQAQPSKAVVRSLGFHPGGRLFMTAGMDRTLRLFEVDGVKNPFVSGVWIEDLPIKRAAFVVGGRQVIAAGRRPFFYVYDVESEKLDKFPGLRTLGGRQKVRSLETFAASPTATHPLVAFLGDAGEVSLVSLKSKSLVASLKMPGSVRTAAFAPDGLSLMTLGGDGTVYTWDVRSQRCITAHVDEGNVSPSALAASPDNAAYATGSASGVVNLYRRGGLGGQQGGVIAAPMAASRLVPEKAVLNLTTRVDSLAFSPDGQLLAMASGELRDAMRLVHVPSMTVFSNWPTSKSPLQYVHCLAFSPGGGFLAVGNAKGRALLYRLHHYQDA